MFFSDAAFHWKRKIRLFISQKTRFYDENIKTLDKETKTYSHLKDIKGTIADQPEISEDLNKALQDAKDMSEKANNNATDALAKADKALAWEDSFGVEAPGFVFIDGKIKNEDGFYYPDGRDIAQLHTDFDIFKNRYSTFEKYVIAQVQMRLTSPDYSQLSNVEYVMGNFFYNSKKRYLHIESFEVGSTIEVFKPLYETTTSISPVASLGFLSFLSTTVPFTCSTYSLRTSLICVARSSLNTSCVIP